MNKPVITTEELIAMVNELGAMNAKLNKLSKRAEAIKACLKLSGLELLDGKKYRAVISHKTRALLDGDKVKGWVGSEIYQTLLKDSRSTSVSLYDL